MIGKVRYHPAGGALEVVDPLDVGTEHVENLGPEVHRYVLARLRLAEGDAPGVQVDLRPLSLVIAAPGAGY
jgi:hypothetical protein